MQTVTVTAKDGARITGPVVLRLTRAQHAANSEALGPLEGRGLYHLAAGQTVELAEGEIFGINVPELAAIAPPPASGTEGKAAKGKAGT